MLYAAALHAQQHKARPFLLDHQQQTVGGLGALLHRDAVPPGSHLPDAVLVLTLVGKKQHRPHHGQKKQQREQQAVPESSNAGTHSNPLLWAKYGQSQRRVNR